MLLRTFYLSKNSEKYISQKLFLAPNQHIRIISERPYDTEDWSNAAENSALPSQEYIII